MPLQRVSAAVTRSLRPALAYMSVAVLTVALFIALHVVGNRLPFDLAVERLSEEFRMTGGGRRDISRWNRTYCRLSTDVLAGARFTRDGGGGLRDAIFLRTFRPLSCDNLRSAVFQGVFKEPKYMYVRHWQGSKALYAIALRYLTVRQFYSAIEALIFCGFLLLALALFAIGWRALLVGTPLLTFGIFFSALDTHANLVAGLPFAWAILATALGAVLLRRGRRSPPIWTARLFFFFAGMVSHFFWLFDGGNFVAATFIGVVAWLALKKDPPRQRVGQAAVCVGVYAAGFAVSLASRAVVVSYLGERENMFHHMFVLRAGHLWERTLAPWPADLVARDLDTFRDLLRMDAPTFSWLLATAAVALVLAVFIGGHRAWRRNPALLIHLLWFAALFLPSCLHFLLPSDASRQASRLMFLPLGLAWCCLLGALTWLPGRQVWAWIGGVGVAVTLAYGGTHLASQWRYEDKLANARVLSASEQNGAFAVYLLDAAAGEGAAGPGRELMYRKSPCSAEDFSRRFVLHVLAPLASLPDRHGWRQRGFVNADFEGYQHGQIFLGTCHATVRLPDYATGIRAGQTLYLGGGSYRDFWMLESDLPSELGEAD